MLVLFDAPSCVWLSECIWTLMASDGVLSTVGRSTGFYCAVRAWK